MTKRQPIPNDAKWRVEDALAYLESARQYLRIIEQEHVSLAMRANLAQAQCRIADAQRELEGIERSKHDLR